MSEDLSFLEEDEPTPAPAAPVEPEPQPAPEPPVEPAPEPAPEPPTEPVAPPAPEPQPIPPGHVPLGAMLTERDRRIAAETRARELEGASQPPPTIPDPYEDPEGYSRYQAAQTEMVTLNLKLDLSEDMSRDRHGDELVDKAKDWALARMANSPAFRAEVLGHRNPYGYAVQEYQRTQLLDEFKDPAEVAAYRAWKAAQTADPAAPQPPAAAPAAPSPAAPPVPPRSLASAPSAGGVGATVVEDPFEAEFPKR